MGFDVSRDTFLASNHYLRVLLQQGRIQLDADFNEQTSILLHHMQTLAADLIGPHGGPDDGFKIEPADADGDLVVLAGHYYVNGILCENARPFMYSGQTGYGSDSMPKLEPGSYLVYLDVWERTVTYIQDERIREVALGGPDTAARSRVTCQVKVRRDPSGQRDCEAIRAVAREQQPPERGRLCAWTEPIPTFDPNDGEPAGHVGLENGLYRVEIHTGGTAGTASYKWSRNNASVVFPLSEPMEAGQNGAIVTLEHLGLDGTSRLSEGDAVEVMDDMQELVGEPQHLLQVGSIDQLARKAVLNGVSGAVVGTRMSLHPYLRRWDHPYNGGDAVTVEENEAHQLENGVMIKFPSAVPGSDRYRPGDYWLISARSATGDVEWPQIGTEPEPRPPRGPLHHYAPLAVVQLDERRNVTVTDCRCPFPRPCPREAG